jgi:2-C-methyl-D-erythritol 4-phosphate cytidylyltransferase
LTQDAGAGLPVWAVVVAAGSGERLGADRPKAFVRLGSRTLLAASLETLEEHPGIDGIVCVVPEGWEERTSLLVDDLCAGKIAAAVAGGRTRSESVARGLDEVPRRRSCSSTTRHARCSLRTSSTACCRG